jgi:hypothetical protein
MPHVSERHSFEYAIVRVVPHIEREEFVNVGVILSCQAAAFLHASFDLDARRLAPLMPRLDIGEIQAHLKAIELICEGGAGAGPIGLLPRRARFDWLVAPRSTVIQTSAVHTGICSDPQQTLRDLLRKMVSVPRELE